MTRQVESPGTPPCRNLMYCHQLCYYWSLQLHVFHTGTHRDKKIDIHKGTQKQSGGKTVPAGSLLSEVCYFSTWLRRGFAQSAELHKQNRERSIPFTSFMIYLQCSVVFTSCLFQPLSYKPGGFKGGGKWWGWGVHRPLSN